MDTVMSALANRYRRRVLVALLNHSPQHDDGPQIPADIGLPDEDTETLGIQLWHIHLPKLEVAGFIEWNQDTSSIRRGPRFDEVRPVLELMQNHADELPDGWL